MEKSIDKRLSTIESKLEEIKETQDTTLKLSTATSTASPQ